MYDRNSTAVVWCMTETVPWWYDREYCGSTTVQKQYYGSMKVLWRHDREYCGGMTDMVLQ